MENWRSYEFLLFSHYLFHKLLHNLLVPTVLSHRNRRSFVTYVLWTRWALCDCNVAYLTGVLTETSKHLTSGDLSHFAIRRITGVLYMQKFSPLWYAIEIPHSNPVPIGDQFCNTNPSPNVNCDPSHCTSDHFLKTLCMPYHITPFPARDRFLTLMYLWLQFVTCRSQWQLATWHLLIC